LQGKILFQFLKTFLKFSSFFFNFCINNITSLHCKVGMSGKGERSGVVRVRDEELILPCEWGACNATFTDMDSFTAHINSHIVHHFAAQGANPSSQGELLKY